MRSSERLVALGGVGMAVASVVPWYTPDQFASFGATRTNGWQEPDALLSQLGIVAGVLLAVVVLVAGRQPSRPAAGGLSWGALLTLGGVVSFGAVALKLSLNLENTTVGIYLALVAGLTQLYGGYVTYLEDKDREPTAPTPFPVAPTPPWQRPPGGGPTPATPGPTTEAPPHSQAPGRPTDVTPSGQAPEADSDPTAEAWRSPGPPPSQPAARTATWPETVYFLQAWAQSGPTIEAAVAAYRQAFAADEPRQMRLLGEVQALLDPIRGETERYELLAAYAPHWSGWPAHQVFAQLARALVERPAP